MFFLMEGEGNCFVFFLVDFRKELVLFIVLVFGMLFIFTVEIWNFKFESRWERFLVVGRMW